MKAFRTLLVAVLFAVPYASIYAQTSSTHQATGVVKSVDPAKNAVVLAHDPVESLKWPAMTMGFTVNDKALLGKLQPGRKIEFEFVQQGRNYVITSVK
jgi:Cu(I)/Ag(I) efflux system periplasmic protein CusF